MRRGKSTSKVAAVSTLLEAAALFAISLMAGRVNATVTYTALTAPAFVDHLPGPDGLIGTADDVVLPGSNPSGSLSFTEFQSSLPLANLTALLTGSVRIDDPLVIRDGTAVMTRFSIDFNSVQTNGYSSSIHDLPGPPHEMTYSFPGNLEVNYWLESCLVMIPQLCLDTELAATGFQLVRGMDPALLPGATPEIVSYLQFLTQIVPPDWTAISLVLAPPTLLDATNTGGSLAFAFFGATSHGATVLVTSDPLLIEIVPEPSAGALGIGSLAVLTLLAAGQRFPR